MKEATFRFNAFFWSEMQILFIQLLAKRTRRHRRRAINHNNIDGSDVIYGRS
jgi:hypothetical protein